MAGEHRSEYGNMVKSIIIFMVEAGIVMWGLSLVAFNTGAGNINYQLSLSIVAAQTAVLIIFYILWYVQVNKKAADENNIKAMREIAAKYSWRTLGICAVVSGVLAALGIVAMVCEFMFEDVNRTYGLSSTLAMFFVGIITLILLMRIWGLPDRVVGKY